MQSFLTYKKIISTVQTNTYHPRILCGLKLIYMQHKYSADIWMVVILWTIIIGANSCLKKFLFKEKGFWNDLSSAHVAWSHEGK